MLYLQMAGDAKASWVLIATYNYDRVFFVFWVFFGLQDITAILWSIMSCSDHHWEDTGAVCAKDAHENRKVQQCSREEKQHFLRLIFFTGKFSGAVLNLREQKKVRYGIMVSMKDFWYFKFIIMLAIPLWMVSIILLLENEEIYSSE